MYGETIPGSVRIGFRAGKAVDAWNAGKPEHVIERTVLQHQDDEVFDSAIVEWH